MTSKNPWHIICNLLVCICGIPHNFQFKCIRSWCFFSLKDKATEKEGRKNNYVSPFHCFDGYFCLQQRHSSDGRVFWWRDLPLHLAACFQDLLSPHCGDSDIFALLKLQILRGSLYWHCCKRAKEVNAPREGEATSCWPSNVKTSSPPSILFFLPPSIPQRKKAKAIKSAQMVKHLLGHFTVAKSVLSLAEQRYKDIF